MLKKLKIELKEESSEDEKEYIKGLYSVYKNGILKRDFKVIKKELENISKNYVIFKDLNNFYNNLLYSFRLHLILEIKNNNVSLANDLEAIKNKLSEKQQFIFNLNMGLYYYLDGKYNLALIQLEKSLCFINNISLEKWELADFHNALGATYLQNYDFLNAMKYASKSLNFYKDNLLYERAIDLYIIMGITYKKIYEYKKAEEYFTLGEKLASDFKLSSYKGIIHQNLGSLFSIQNNPKKAIEHFKLSLKYKKAVPYSESHLITILSIIKEFSKQDNPTHVKKWCQIGLKQINEVKIPGYISDLYYFHFNIYKVLFSEDLNIEFTLKKALKFFRKIEDKRHLQKYSILFADYLYKKNRFKEAGFYYQTSNEIMLQQKKVNTWEDL